MRPTDNIENFVKNAKVKTNPAVNEAVLNDLLNRLEPAGNEIQSPRPDIWRVIMNSKISKAAIAAVILIAVWIGLNINGTGVAFGEVLHNIQKRAYRFQVWIEQDGNQSQMSSGTVMEPGLVRWTTEDDSPPFGDTAIVFDAINNKMIWISKTGRIIGHTEFPEDEVFDLWTKTITNLWQLRDGSEEKIGKKEIHGKKTFGFKVISTIQGGSMEILVWADMETEHPVQVEMIPRPDNPSDAEDFKLILSDFEYDIEIDPTLFGLATPQQEEADDRDQYVIYPGKGIGELEFGMSVEQMKEIMGEPDMVIGNSAFQYAGFALTAPRDQIITGLMCGDPNPTDQTRVAECKYRTAEGIGIGSSEQEIIAAFGPPSTKRSGHIENSIELIYRDMRMKFLIYEGQVTHMSFGSK